MIEASCTSDPGRRTGARRRHLDQDAGDVHGSVADLVHDEVRRRPRLPIGELELNDADRALGPISARLFADAGVDRLEALRSEHRLLDFADGIVLLVEREVAAAVRITWP